MAEVTEPGSEAAAELAGELRRLRTVVRQAGEQFILRREGEIEGLLGALESLSLPPRDTAKWLSAVRRLKLKPHKGRLRDLRAIRELLAALGEEMQERAEPVPRPPLRPRKKKRSGSAGG